MHYDRWTFSKNGEPTIIPKKPDAIIGDAQRLSPTDVEEIRRFYECNE